MTITKQKRIKNKKEMANSVKYKENVKVLSSEYKLKEAIDETTGKVTAVYLEGVAIKFGIPTRNRVAYTYSSGVETYKSMEGKPFLDTHNDSSIRTHPPFGHVCSEAIDGQSGAWLGTHPELQIPCLFYRVNVDPDEQTFIKKAKRHDIPGVSIQVLVNEIFDKQDEAGEYIEANIGEFLELSAVLIPGDGDTTMAFAERFKGFKEGGYKEPVGGKKIGDTPEEEPDAIKKVKPMVGIGSEAEDAEEIKFDSEKAYKKNRPDEEKESVKLKDLAPEKGDEEDTEFEYKGKKVLYNNNENLSIQRQFTEVAYHGCKCTECNSQMLKDNFVVPSINYETFQLRCSNKECGKIIVKDDKALKQAFKNAKRNTEEC